MTDPMNFDATEEAAQAAGAAAAVEIAAACSALAGATIIAPKAHRLAEAEAIVAKAAARAAKLGIDPVRLVVLGDRTTERTVEIGGLPFTYRVTRAVLALHGAAPRVAGYRLVARVEHTEAGNLVARSPVGAADVDLAPYRDAAPACEHCGAARRRKDTFVLCEEATGTLRQVGRNCLADYLRSEDVAEALALWKLLATLSGAAGDGDDEGFGGGGYRGDIATADFIACAVTAVRLRGFHKSDSDRPTVEDARFAASPLYSNDAGTRRAWADAQPTDADWARAKAVQAWVATTDDTSDYLRNLRIACALPGVGRHGGLLASAPTAYARHVERLVVARREQEAPRGAHVGTVGARVDLGDLTVLRTRFSDGAYGTTTIVALVDGAGNRMTWFASGAKDFEAGTVLRACKATIKRHGDFRGTPDTTITRLAWADEVKVAA